MEIKTLVENILRDIDLETSNLDLFGCEAIANIIRIINLIESKFSEVRKQVVDYNFPTIEEEVVFFKELKPEILSRLLYFNKVYSIESKFPIGSKDAARQYLNDQLKSIEYYFNKQLDFYQYYRSRSTAFDEYYFVRGSADIRLCTDSCRFDKDPKFSTGYDYKVAKILSNEMLRIHINQRLILLDTGSAFEEKRQFYVKTPLHWTGTKAALIELVYALTSVGDINHGNVEIKEAMDFIGAMFNVDLGDYYRTYITLKGRKKDRVAYLNLLIERLTKKMDEEDEK